MTVPLPRGWTVVPDDDNQWSTDGTCLYGGSPWRLLRLTDSGTSLARRLLSGAAVDDDASAALARRLTDAGLAHPVPPPQETPDTIDVVIPAYGRPAQVDACLTALQRTHSVLVVDDGSPDAADVADVAERHGAQLLRMQRNAGPAAARNAGAARSTTRVVAFVDSDVTVDAAMLSRLVGHFADPTVGAVAPRVLPAAHPTTALARFADVGSPLDLGPRPASVRPHSRVPYVPSTVLLVRRSAFDAVGGFDEALRYGEDVDLVWRLVDVGWVVRYDPPCTARHTEPTDWWSWARRRFHYGASAGPLARRHGSRLAGPSPVALLAALRVRRSGQLPTDVAHDVAALALKATADGLLRWGGPIVAPPLLLGAMMRGSVRGAVVAIGIAAAARPVAPKLAPAAAVDTLSYGAGVWWGALRSRTLRPLLPRLRRTESVSS